MSGGGRCQTISYIASPYIPHLFWHARRVGRFYPKRLSDLTRAGAALRVTCPECGHGGAYEPAGVIQWFRHKRLNDDWTIAGSYFRCEECGHRGAQLGWEPLYPAAPPAPAPIESLDQAKQRQRRERG